MAQAGGTERTKRAQTLLVRVGNLRELHDAYGGEFCAAAMVSVQERLMHCGVLPDAMLLEHEFVVVDLRSTVVHHLVCEHQIDGVMQRVRAQVAREPVECGINRAYLRVFVDVLYAAVHGESSELLELALGDLVSRHADIAALHENRHAALRNDMQAACSLLDELRAGNLILGFQPIMLLDKTGDAACLYSEALLRRSSPTDARIYSWPNAIQALERLGWISRLDASVVWTVVRLLERYPLQRIGANLSAASLHRDAWWNVLLAYLKANPTVASRLTLEITETSAVIDSGYALTLIAKLQMCGTRIALDDMGAGHTTLEFLSSARADVVKIDRSILLRSRELQHSPDLLRNLARVCADYSPCVVVEGIESKTELQTARYAGAKGVQGYWIERPSIQPDWLVIQKHAVVLDAYALVAGSAKEALFQPHFSPRLSASKSLENWVGAETLSSTPLKNTSIQSPSAKPAYGFRGV